MTALSQIMEGYRNEMVDAQKEVGRILYESKDVETPHEKLLRELDLALELYEMRCREYRRALHALLSLPIAVDQCATVN